MYTHKKLESTKMIGNIDMYTVDLLRNVCIAFTSIRVYIWYGRFKTHNIIFL